MTPDAPRGAHHVFADRLPLAERYVRALATSGVERGLIGPREVERLWSRHVLNCAVVAPALEPGATVVDLGSGAGLPGLPLALARPDLEITLLEPMARRCAWLDEVVADLGIGDSVRVVRGRAEDASVVAALAGADVVTARAVAPLARLAGWALPLLRDGGTLLAMKGQSAEEEIARDGHAVRALGGGTARVRDYGDGIVDPRTRVVLVTRKESPRAAAGAGRATRRRRRS